MMTAEREQLEGVGSMRRYLATVGVNVSSPWLYGQLQSGRVPAVKIASRWYVTRARLRAALGLDDGECT